MLLDFRTKYLPLDEEDKSRLIIRRKHLFADAFRRFKTGTDLNKYLSITFVGEAGVDTGGPLREFLRLLNASIFSSNSLFCGSAIARVPTHNTIELDKKTYYFVGATMALCFIHGGPPPRCLSSAVADYIVYGIQSVKATPDDIPDNTLKDKMLKVCFNWGGGGDIGEVGGIDIAQSCFYS